MKARILVCLLLIVSLLAPKASYARWMNPSTGRFHTMDTFEGDQRNPQSLHKYTYAHADPVNNTDPNGQFVVETLVVISIVGIVAATLTGCSSDPTPSTALIVHADPGHSGRNFEMTAHTHKRELQRGGIWDAPIKPQTRIDIAKATTVSQFVGNLKGRKLAYLAYYGHSSPRALHFGMTATPDTNLAEPDYPYGNVGPVSTIPASSFSKDALIRLFGCRAGMGSSSIAQSIASHTKKPVWAYTNPQGSLFTDDPLLGHGQRSITQADIDKFEPSRGGRFIQPDMNKDFWLVPAATGSYPSWHKFTP